VGLELGLRVNEVETKSTLQVRARTTGHYVYKQISIDSATNIDRPTRPPADAAIEFRSVAISLSLEDVNAMLLVKDLRGPSFKL